MYYPSPRQLNDPFDCQLCFDSRLEQFVDVDRNQLVLVLMALAMDRTGTSLRFSADEDIPFQQRFDYLCEDFLSCIFKYGVHSLSECPDNPLMWSHYVALVSFVGSAVWLFGRVPRSERLISIVSTIVGLAAGMVAYLIVGPRILP